MEQPITEGAKKRPTFLTVLCILSFIAAGFVIIGGILGYLAMAAVSGMGEAVMESMKEMEGFSSMPGMEDPASVLSSAKTQLIAAIVLTIIGLVGVIMMWQLKKTGFYVYAGANVLAIIAPIAIAGMAQFSVVGTIITIAFIVMYGLNLKHMS